MGKLYIYADGAVIREVALEGECTFGRHPTCTVQIEGPRLSRVHGVLSMVSDSWCIRDLSRNGITRNGVRIEPQVDVPLTDGDALSFGGFEASVSLEGAVGSPTMVASEGGGDAGAPVQPQELRVSVPQAVDQAPEPSPLLAHLIEDRDQTAVWTKGEIELKVADIIEETNDCKTYRLVGAEPTLFSYKPGQFLTLSVDIDGTTHKRSYSISSSPSRPHTLELTIKRVPGGLISNWMADEAKLGDVFSVRGPAGKFSCFNFPSRRMLYVAAGSGITPLMSMMRWVVDTAADVDVTLLASFRTPQEIIFRKELEQLSARHSGLRIMLTLTSEWSGTEAWTGLRGRIDARMLQFAVPDLSDRHLFLCGPKPFSDAVKGQLKELGFPIAQLHTESFGSGRVSPGTKVEPRDAVQPSPAQAAPPPVPAQQPAAVEAGAEQPAPQPPAQPPAVPAQEPAAGTLVRFAKSDVEVRSDGSSCLLEIAEVNGVELDYGCREGACGACMVKLVSGEVEMADCDLDDGDRSQGMIYACVSKPKTDLVLDA